MVLETLEGVYVDPFTAGASGYLAIDPAMAFELDIYERNIKRGTLTPNQPLTGAKHGRATFGLEFIGSGGAGSPQIDLPLQACGFRREVLRKITIGAIAGGPFKHGETITETTSTATMTCVQDTYNGQTTLWVSNTNGLGNGTTILGTNVLTGATSGATATGSAITANAGIGYWPASSAQTKLVFQSTITTALSAGDIVTNATGTAYGQVQIGWATTFIFILIRRISGHFANSDVVTRVSDAAAVGTIVATGTSNVIQQVSPTVSVGVYLDGVRESIRGARGTPNFNGRYGQPFIGNFDIQGVYQAVVDGGPVTGITYPSPTPPVLIDADVGQGKTATTFAGEFAPCISEIGIDMQNEVGPRICMSDTSGILQYEVTGRNGQITLDPELNAEAIWDYMAQFLTNTPSRLRFTVGSALGNKFLITMPAISYTAAPTGDRSGISTRQLTGRLTTGSATALAGDAEMVIVYQIL